MNISDIQKRKKWLEKSIGDLLNEFADSTKTRIHEIKLNQLGITQVSSEKPKYLHSIKIKIVL